MSFEDSKFMELVSSAATFKDVHYYLPQPLCDRDITILNNCQVAE